MNRSFSVLLLIAIGLACLPVRAQTDSELTGLSDDKKSGLRILYVGPNPDEDIRVPSYITGAEAERYVVLKKERMEAFETFLKTHFKTVVTVNAEEFVPDMSDDADVTIFDERPPKVATKKVDGWDRRILLPDDYDKPALMVGEVGPLTLGRMGKGLLIDHL